MGDQPSHEEPSLGDALGNAFAIAVLGLFPFFLFGASVMEGLIDLAR